MEKLDCKFDRVKSKKSPKFTKRLVSEVQYETYLSKNGLSDDQGLLLISLVRLMDGDCYLGARTGYLYCDGQSADMYKIKRLLKTVFNYSISQENLKEEIELFRSKKILISMGNSLTAPYFFRRAV